MKIATWNINGVKARLESAVTWLKETSPTSPASRRSSRVDRGLPGRGLRGRSATTSPCTGRRASTASPCSRSARSTRWPCAACPATRATRTPATSRWWCRAPAASCASATSTCPTAIPSAPTSSPTSWPGWSGCEAHARDLLALEEPFLLLGDYNVIPEPVDAKNPQAWPEDALFQPETRAAFRALLNLGLTDAVRACHPGARHLHVLGLPGRRLAEGPRHPHRPHPALAAGRRPARWRPASTSSRAAGRSRPTTCRCGSSCGERRGRRAELARCYVVASLSRLAVTSCADSRGGRSPPRCPA